MKLPAGERPPPGRLTFGLLTTNIEEGTGLLLWSGVSGLCQKNGVNLVSFVGSELRTPEGFSRQANLIFEMVDSSRLDGMVIWSSSLSTYIRAEIIQSFCERYMHLPLVGIGMPLRGIPSILLDSYQSMREAMLHLVVDHGRKRMALLRGPEMHQEGRLRYHAYLDLIKGCGLDNDPNLVTPAMNWSAQWGKEAARILVEERNQEFDALACANDQLAIGAMEYFQEKGIRVPDDVAIVGFDDNLEGRFVKPPLTTVPNRMKERGEMAASMLLSQVKGEAVPELVKLNCSLLIRQSCGCPGVMIQDAGEPDPPLELSSQAKDSGASLAQFAVQRDGILEAMAGALPLADAPSGWASDLLDAFTSSLLDADAAAAGPADVPFLTELQRLLDDSDAVGGDLIYWQCVVNLLRSKAVPLLNLTREKRGQAERYLHQARVMISGSAVRAQGYLEWKKSRALNHLLRVRQRVSGARDLKELVDNLVQELPQLGIQTCYLALYEDPQQPLNNARLILAYEDGCRLISQEGRVFTPTWKLAPFAPEPVRPMTLAFYPLFYRDEQLGVILFDANVLHDNNHKALCQQISSALKSVRLIDENTLLYRQALDAQREAEEANLLKSRFLSMVSHELLTPIVLLMGLSEMMLREGILNRPPLPEAYHRDLTRIQASAQHLGSLVRDVLDLARGQLGQLKLLEKPVNMEEVFQPVLLVGEQLAQSKGLAWRAKISPDLPMVMGDKSRLQQVTLNLVNNAIKFTAQGEIALIAEAKDGFVSVSVQDTGIGVSLDEQEVIFDEFRQSDRTVSRGFGGLGIGLAICRQLIEMQGGKIGVRSSGAENSGSTFYYLLPGIHSQGVQPPAAHSQVVLVMTSRAEQADPLREHLFGEGFQVAVIGVEETPDWLAAVQSIAPGAVIMDVPVAARGLEFIQTLKSSPATADIPVIFYSLLHEQSSGSMLMMDYLVKPFTSPQLDLALGHFGFPLESPDAACTVLVVDDNPDILDLHARLVATHIPGCQVLRATNGLEALALMRQTRPNLVLLDLLMPELDGPGVLSAMHKDEQLREIPVIVVTAQSLTGEQMAHLDSGVVSVLSKGIFTAQETLSHIDRALALSKRVGSDTQRLVRKVMAFIHEHYAEPLSRDQLSRYARVSERHLNRCFMQETGLTPGVYLNRYRIQKAKDLLRARNSSITEVMHAVGFSDSSYFTHVFRKETGVSPSEYQRGKK